MRLFRTVLVPMTCALAAVTACSTNNSPGNQSPDRTTPVSATQATTSAVVTGQVDTSVSGNVRLSVNGNAKRLVLAPDQSFVVRDVPTGDVVLSCDAGNVQGQITIKNVQQGEIIQVLVKREGDAIVIVIIQRTASSQPPQEVTGQQGAPLVITASHACYWLKPGHYKRDIVVKGNDVHLFGAEHDSCTIDDYTILDGKLELDGDHDTVLDVDLSGSLVIAGNHCSVQDSCTGCYDDSCEHCCGHEDQSDQHLSCGGDDGGEEEAGADDAGLPAQDGGKALPDAGGVTSPDAGCTSCDAGVAPRDGSADAMDAGSTDAKSGG